MAAGLAGRRRHNRIAQGLLRQRAALEGSPEGPSAENYVPVVVRKANGDTVEVDVRMSDGTEVLKAMLAAELGVSEDQQELSFEGTTLEDGIQLSQVGIAEGSCIDLVLKAVEESGELEALPTEAAKDGEVCIRVFVKCDMVAGKSKRVGLDVTATETIGEVKLRAFNVLTKAMEGFRMGQGGADAYGLFVPKGPTTDAKGQLRFLRREERLRDKRTVEECGLSGGEEIAFVNLYWSE